MNRAKLILAIFFVLFVLSSCEKDFTKWREFNESWLENNKPYVDSLARAPVKVNYDTAGITASGIQYIVIHSGYGPIAKRNSIVTISYKNSLVDGKSVGKTTNYTKPIKDLIDGWQEMFCDRGIRQGSKLKVFIPWQLAYTDKGAKSVGVDRYVIPPYSTFISELELQVVVNQPPQ